MCLLQTKTFPVYKNVLRFQNEYNKVEIELRVVQFWTEIKLVITNRTPASRSCDFVITRLISVQIALHSVQLPLYIWIVLSIESFETIVHTTMPMELIYTVTACYQQQAVPI